MRNNEKYEIYKKYENCKNLKFQTRHKFEQFEKFKAQWILDSLSLSLKMMSKKKMT